MTSVENHSGMTPVKYGFGNITHAEALKAAGAKHVFLLRDRIRFFEELDITFRSRDVLIVCDPKLFEMDELKTLADHGITMEVPGHEPEVCRTYEMRKAFRKRKPKAKGAPDVEARGRPATIKCTRAQAIPIIKKWHAVPRKTPVVVTASAENFLGLDAGTLSKTWVRDLVIKYVGTARRDEPDVWTGKR